VACGNSITDVTSVLDWKLTVSPSPIESGELFVAALDGVAVFNEFFLDEAQPLVPGGVQEANLVSLNATVHVRKGATGNDVTLEPEPIPYVCDTGRTACDPANDVVDPDNPLDAPGLRANTDCKPANYLNPCGRFIRLPISTECGPGGICADMGKTGQCADNDFCVTGDLRLDLERASGEYTAHSQGNVLFGWADESTDATIQEGGHNPGTWSLPPVVYEDPTGPIGVRIGIGPVLLALECTMGVGSGFSPFSRPTPDPALISFPIQAP
jgi:hypothetical protein